MRGSIVKRKTKEGGKPLYYVVIRNKWHKVPGKQTKANAEAYCTELLGRLYRGEYISPHKISFAEFAENWMTKYAAQLSPNSQQTHSVWLRNQLVPYWGNRLLTTITVEDVEGFKIDLLKTLSPQSVKSVLQLLRQMFSKAMDWGYLRNNVARKVRSPKVPKQEMGFLTPEEVVLFLDKAPNHFYYTFFLTAITCGLRMGEMLAMQWQHLDWNRSTYFVAQNYAYVPKEKVIKSPKTESSNATVDVSAATLEALRIHKRQQTELRLAAGPNWEDNDYIFPREDGRIMEPTVIGRRYFHGMLAEAGIRRLRFHDLRHTTATLLLNQGENLKYVQRQMRHASASITLDRYSHILPSTRQEATQRLDDTIFGKQIVPKVG